MSTAVTHFQADNLFGGVTACGKSLHGWNIHQPKLVTDQPEFTTCKRCLAKM